MPEYPGVLNPIEVSAQFKVDIRVVSLKVRNEVAEGDVEVCYVIAMHEDGVLYTPGQ